MKQTPRRYENRVAEELNRFFSDAGMELVRRIPVTGTRGPDITPNELGLVIDCKLRKEIPLHIVEIDSGVNYADVYIAFPLYEFPMPEIKRRANTVSLVILGHLRHIQDICEPGQIPVLIVNKPKRRVIKSIVIIPYEYWEEYVNRVSSAAIRSAEEELSLIR